MLLIVGLCSSALQQPPTVFLPKPVARIVRGAPDRRSLHFSTIATSHWLPPQASRHIPHPPGPTLPFSSNPSPPPPYTPPPPPPPPPHLSYAPDSLLPLPPSSRPGPSEPFQWHSLSTTLPFPFPVHRIHWSRHSLSPLCPFCPSSILQTSVCPGLLIPSAFYIPPALN